MSRREELAGRRFGRWTVLEFSHESPLRIGYWLCVCACGTRKTVAGNSLRAGTSRQCVQCGHRGRRKDR